MSENARALYGLAARPVAAMAAKEGPVA
jgi:hypothetical protein